MEATLSAPPAASALFHSEPPRYADLWSLAVLDRIGLVRAGLPASMLKVLARDMDVPSTVLYTWLGIPRTTANRKANSGETLSPTESEGVLGVARLVGQVATMVAESGDPTGFNAATWTAHWLQEPHPALGGRPPGELLDTFEGRTLISGLLSQMQSGAYS